MALCEPHAGPIRRSNRPSTAPKRDPFCLIERPLLHNDSAYTHDIDSSPFPHHDAFSQSTYHTAHSIYQPGRPIALSMQKNHGLSVHLQLHTSHHRRKIWGLNWRYLGQ